MDPGNGKWGRRLDRVEDGRQGRAAAVAEAVAVGDRYARSSRRWYIHGGSGSEA